MAAAASASVSHGRLVSLAVLATFLLGALWLASALHISRSVGRCLAVEGSVWRDEECFVYIRWTATATFIALVFVAALSYGEAARRREQMDAAGGARGGDGRPGPKPERDLGAAGAHAIAYFPPCLICAVLILFGKAFRYAGARGLEKDPADAAAAFLFQSGLFYYNAGYLAWYAVHCCAVIPYLLFVLMRYVRDKCVGSLEAQGVLLKSLDS